MKYSVALLLPVAPLFGRAFIFASIAFYTQLVSSKSHTNIASALHFTFWGRGQEKKGGKKQGSTGVSGVYETGNIRMG